MLGGLLLSFLFLGVQDKNDQGDRGEELREAARRGDLDEARSLLESGVDVDAENRYGATALFFAADKGDVAMVKFLLERGARTDVTDRFYQMSPLTRALSNDHQDVGLLLLERSLAAGDLSRDDFDELLQEARRSSWSDIVALLERTKPPAADSETVVRLEESEVERLVGSYRNDKTGETIEILAGDEGLSLLVGTEAIALRPVSPSELILEERGERLFFGGRGGMVERVLWQRGSSAAETVAYRPLEEGELDPGTNPAGAAHTANETGREDIVTGESRAATTVSPRPWPSFRGPNTSGIADAQGLPIEWDVPTGKNVRFATEIPGLSVSSPIIWGDRIFVLTAVSGASDRTFRTGLYGDVAPVEDVSEHRWLLYALDSSDGRIVWSSELHRGRPGTKRHPKSSQANATPATDGRHLVTLLGSPGFLYCHDLNGNLLWKKELGVLNAGWFYDPDYQWGHASSPVLYEGSVIIQADVHGGAFLAAFDLDDGRELWRTPREGEIPTFATPAIYRGPTGDELVTNGTLIRSYDPKNGALLWHLGPNSEIPVGSPVVSSELIYIAAGYPPIRPIYAVRPGSRGDLALPDGVDRSEALAWSKTRGGTYIPTPLVYRGYFYTNEINGLLVCYDAVTGELVYRARIGGVGGSYAASPIASDGRLYFTSEEGETFVVEAGPKYREVAKNSVDAVVLATPAASNGLLVIRTLERVYGLSR